MRRLQCSFSDRYFMVVPCMELIADGMLQTMHNCLSRHYLVCAVEHIITVYTTASHFITSVRTVLNGSAIYYGKANDMSVQNFCFYVVTVSTGLIAHNLVGMDYHLLSDHCCISFHVPPFIHDYAVARHCMAQLWAISRHRRLCTTFNALHHELYPSWHYALYHTSSYHFELYCAKYDLSFFHV